MVLKSLWKCSPENMLYWLNFLFTGHKIPVTIFSASKSILSDSLKYFVEPKKQYILQEWVF